MSDTSFPQQQSAVESTIGRVIEHTEDLDTPTSSSGQNLVSLSAILSSLGSLQSARFNGPDESAGHGHLTVPRIQLRITSGGSTPPDSESLNTNQSSQTRDGPSLSRALLRHLSRGGMSRSSQTQSGSAVDASRENLAAAAERHRLSNTTVIDLQATARWLESSLCFISLLLLVFLYHHITEFAVFIWLTVVLVRANSFLRKQSSLKEQRRAKSLVAIALLLLLHIPTVFFMFQGLQLETVFWFVVPKEHLLTVWDALFRVTVVDALVRYCGMVVKVFILLASKGATQESFRRRGNLLTLVEHVLLLYRAALPIPVWYNYYDSRQMPLLLFSFCAGMYIMFKCSLLFERGMGLGAAFRMLLHPEGQYGQYATPEEVAETGNTCAICQEAMAKPIKLQCSHIYCEACIAEWFERERTCPMCRALVKPTGLSSFNDCSTSLLPQLF